MFPANRAENKQTSTKGRRENVMAIQEIYQPILGFDEEKGERDHDYCR